MATALEQTFKEAAGETLERIRTDRERAPRRIKPLLEYLEHHLFDADLDYQCLKRVCRIRDNNLPTQFHKALGMPPAAYIRDCRLEVAWRLLGTADLKIGEIAELLGYSSLQTFGRAFKRWCGLSPAAFRRQQRQSARSDNPWNGVNPVMTRRAAAGQLETHEARVLLRRLLSIYPEVGELVEPWQAPQLANRGPIAMHGRRS